jgi:hypothetical protein
MSDWQNELDRKIQAREEAQAAPRLLCQEEAWNPLRVVKE